jgi:hypothetical protein
MRMDVMYTDNLHRLMAAKVEVLEQLCELAKQQTTITQSGDATILLSFLSRKQPLMDRLGEIQEDLSIYAADDPAQRQWRSPEVRRTCRADSQRCQQLLSEIVLLEKQSLDEMSMRRDALAAQLQDGQDGTQAAKAYHSVDALSEGSLDLTSAG